jgi:hypothetical protein
MEQAVRATQSAGLTIANDKRGRPAAAVFGTVSAPSNVKVTDASSANYTYPASWYKISSAQPTAGRGFHNRRRASVRSRAMPDGIQLNGFEIA